MAERLAAEAYEAANDRGSAIKKHDDTHKMAEANHCCPLSFLGIERNLRTRD